MTIWLLIINVTSKLVLGFSVWHLTSYKISSSSSRPGETSAAISVRVLPTSVKISARRRWLSGLLVLGSVLDEKSCRGRSPVSVTAPTILVGWPVWVYFSFCILFRIIPISIFSNVLIFYSAISNTLSVPYSAIFILEMFFISKSSIWLDSIHLFPHNMHVSLYLLF